MGAVTIVRGVLLLFAVFMFFFAGLMKVTDQVNPEVHNELK
jgi:hypothetical protein